LRSAQPRSRNLTGCSEVKQQVKLERVWSGVGTDF
jgi:hypothetical protein